MVFIYYSFANYSFYSYQEDPYANDTGTVYPEKIEYNTDKKRVIEFVLESSDRSDSWLAYENGNKITESRKVKEVVIKADSSLVRRYVINYTTLDIDSRSFISSVVLVGDDNITSLSPVSLEDY